MKSRERIELTFIVGIICIIIPLLMTPFIVSFVITVREVNNVVSGMYDPHGQSASFYTYSGISAIGAMNFFIGSFTDSSIVNNFNCSSRTLVKAIQTTECVSEPYTEDMCTQLLTTTQSCSVGARNSILVNTTGNQQSLETNLTTFLNILERNGSQRCRDAALPFMCQYTFPLCDNNTKQLYLPTQERCIEISEQVCSQEWNQTRQLGYQNLLPNCTTLKRQALQNITCRDDFISLNGTCQARCGENKIQSSANVVVTRVVRFVGALLAVVGGGVFLIASIVRYKEMFSFPLIILVYMTAEVFVLGIVLLVAESGFPHLLCNSASLLASIANPTVLCLISGAIFHYTIVGMYVFWTFHIGYFFYKVMFPFHANAHQSYKKYIHVTMAICGFLAPLPAVIAALAVDDNRYALNLFFLPLCFPKNRDITTYSTNLIITMLLLISTVLLIIIFWKVHKPYELENGPLLNTAEKKLLPVLSLSIFAGVVLFISVVSVRLTVTDQASLVVEYFNCESDGYVPGKCNRAALRQDVIVWFTSASYFILGATPLINLLFVVDFKKMKEKIMTTISGFNSQSRLTSSSKVLNGHTLQNSREELQKSATELLDKTNDS